MKKKIICFAIIFMIIGYAIGQLPILNNHAWRAVEDLEFKDAHTAELFSSLGTPNLKIIEEDDVCEINFYDVDMAFSYINFCIQSMESAGGNLMELTSDEAKLALEFLHNYRLVLFSLYDDGILENNDKFQMIKEIETKLNKDIFMNIKLSDEEREYAVDKKGNAVGEDGTRYDEDKLNVLRCKKIVALLGDDEDILMQLQEFKDTYYSNLP